MKNGQTVAAFERAFADYVGAKYAIALCNGTATLHTALVALGVKPGDKVATTPLTMSATSIAILQAGAVPQFIDVDERTWLMTQDISTVSGDWRDIDTLLPVSLYGLHAPDYHWERSIDDAAQTLRPHNKGASFTSYSFQASKILALGEGGMLVTDSEELATKAREFSSLGYRMKADQPRIDSSVIKAPDYERHHSLGWNYRMNDLTAAEGLKKLPEAPVLITRRAYAADLYSIAIKGCSWITPQYVPEGWTHDYWTFAIALESKELWKPFTDAIVRYGGEMPYGAWALTYKEPAFKHLAPKIEYRTDGQVLRDEVIGMGFAYSGCPIAESLQPRLVQFQTNDLASAERNAKAVKLAIQDIDRSRSNRVFNGATRAMEEVYRAARNKFLLPEDNSVFLNLDDPQTKAWHDKQVMNAVESIIRLVHNHGTEEGPGLACKEWIVNGVPIGECMLSGDATGTPRS